MPITCTSTTTCTYFVDVDVHVLVDGCCHLQICFQKVKDFRPSNTNHRRLYIVGERDARAARIAHLFSCNSWRVFSLWPGGRAAPTILQGPKTASEACE